MSAGRSDKSIKSIRTHTFVNKDFIEQVPGYLFDPRNHCLNSGISNEDNEVNGGRGTALNFQYKGHDLILKRYYRGGLPGRFVKESYFFTGIENTRMWKEFHLLQRLHTMGLPVPVPVAARCELQTPLSYKGALIMEYLRDSRTLADIISETRLSHDTWSQVGEIIREFHLNDVFHADLNANNILLTKDRRIYLIDFDKCLIRKHMPLHVLSGNLERLKRSLDKIKMSARLSQFNFDTEHWKALERGYQRSKTALSHGVITCLIAAELLPVVQFI